MISFRSPKGNSYQLHQKSGLIGADEVLRRHSENSKVDLRGSTRFKQLMRKNKDGPWVLGYSTNHNGSVCLLRGDQIAVAIQEERLVRQKRASLAGPDCSAIRYCLDTAGIRPADIDSVVMASVNDNAIQGVADLRMEGFDGSWSVIPHYLSHAYAAFATCGFEDAVVLVVDGGGEFTSSLKDKFPSELVHAKYAIYPEALDNSRVEKPLEIVGIYECAGTEVNLLEKHIGFFGDVDQANRLFYGSFGGMFSAVAQLLFGNLLEAGKVMGLAPYGKPSIPVEELLSVTSDGVFEFLTGVDERFSQHEEKWPAHEEEYCNLACSIQAALEYGLAFVWDRCAELSKRKFFAYSGGVALNSVANEKLIRQRRFREHYIMPAAEDSGTAIGAAYFGLWQLTRRNSATRLHHDSLGRMYADREIEQAFHDVPFVREVDAHDIVDFAVDALCDNKIIGWFDGKSELGPRALGQRSILCDPRRANAKEILNSRVKHREAFRPFAPVILEQEVAGWFQAVPAEPTSPFMLRVFDFKEEARSKVPAVTHVDGTGRVQTVSKAANGRYYEVVERFFRKTGVPILLNTSFNVMGEPIVESPYDALWCLLFSGLDYVCFKNAVVELAEGYSDVLEITFELTMNRDSMARLPSGQYLVQNSCSWGPRVAQLSSDASELIAVLDGPTPGRVLVDRLGGIERSSQKSHWTKLRFTRAVAALHRAGILDVQR